MNIYEKLCVYDKRNPYHIDEDKFDNECACDNCFYGRDVLAKALLECLEHIATTSFAVGDTADELLSKYLKRTCEDCGDEFGHAEGRPYKYEPSIWVCDGCHDNRMEEDV